MLSDVGGSDGYVLRPDDIFDDPDGIERLFLRTLDTGSLRSPQPYLELAAIHLGQDVLADMP